MNGTSACLAAERRVGSYYRIRNGARSRDWDGCRGPVPRQALPTPNGLFLAALGPPREPRGAGYLDACGGNLPQVPNRLGPLPAVAHVPAGDGTPSLPR